MSTHGTIAIRKKEEVFVFHPTHDGFEVGAFMLNNKNPSSIDDLILDAVRFCSRFDGGYEDRTSVNLYVEKFDPGEDYSKMTEYSVFYDEQKYRAQRGHKIKG